MNTPQAQIKINLPLPLKEFLDSKARKFGLPIATYVKHLIIRDVREMEYPEFELSEKAESAFKKALKDHKAGKAIRIQGDIKTFLENI